MVTSNPSPIQTKPGDGQDGPSVAALTILIDPSAELKFLLEAVFIEA